MLRPPQPAATDSRFSALPWSDFFDSEEDITIDSANSFHIYRAGSSGPLVFCLHGGGYCGLSFAVAASRMKSEVQVVAMDQRGHGLTTTDNDGDLSAERLVSDAAAVLSQLLKSSPSPVVLVGHSMGGAIAVRLAESLRVPSIAALVVVDVVEGTAMSSLVHMRTILASRPSSFPSTEKAIEWSVRMGTLRNVESARVSVPLTLKHDKDKGRFVWRTPLEDSEQYWEGWYKGLSEAFLRCPVAKLLLLAGTDRLDKPLTIAQMQGRFQMLVVPHSGHAIQEDEPADFASRVLHFVSRNRISHHGQLMASWGGAIHS